MMQLTLVTGNNQKKTISEFKASDFSNLKSSLCTLVMHATNDILYYAVYYNKQCKYLKKLDWSENFLPILNEEFNKLDSFFAVHVFIQGSQSTILPSSLYTYKTNNFGIREVLPNLKLETTNLGSNIKLVLAIPSEIIDSIYKVFPEATIHSTVAPIYHSLPKIGIHVAVINHAEDTQIIITQGSQILLCEKYVCPTPTEILYFTLSALKVNRIEDQSLCTFHLCCDTKGPEIYTFFKDYFEKIMEFYQDSNTFGFPLSSNDLKDFQIVLNALPCVS